MGFWDNEGMWAAMGGGLGGAMQVGGANASMADWLAAFAYGSGQAVDQRGAQMEQERRRMEAEARAAEDRRMQLEDRAMRQKALQEAAAEKLRMDVAGQARDTHARLQQSDPYIVANDLPAEAFPNPGDFAADAARRQQAQAAIDAKQQEDEANRKMLEGAGFGYLISGDPELNAHAAKKLIENKMKGPDTPSASEGLAREKFDYEKGQDEAAARAAAKALPYKEWNDAYDRNLKALASAANGQKDPETLQAEAQAMTTRELGAKPLNPGRTVSAMTGGEGGGLSGTAKLPTFKPAPVKVPEFAGSMPTAAAKVSSPTGTTAPPKVTADPTLKKIEAAKKSIDAMFPTYTPQEKAELRDLMLRDMDENKITFSQALANVRASAKRLGSL